MTTASKQQLLNELKVEKLPSLPHVLVSMLEACQSHTTNFQQISRIINQDSAIAAKVISLANSSFYRRETDVNSIDRALMVLGTDTIRTLVITASIQQFFSKFSTPHIEFLKRFWRQSLACAHIAKSLALLTSYSDADEAYLSGILHNIGELVLSSHNPEKFLELKSIQSIHSNQLTREKTLFGATHTDIGAVLMREWRLSQLASEAIEFHHAPVDKILDAHHLVKLIYLAAHLSEKLIDPKSSEEELKSSLNKLNLGHQLFELNPSLLFEIVSKIQNEVDEISKSLDIKIGTQTNDQNAQITLARYVRSIGLVQTVNSHINQARSLEDLNRAFGTTVELLFGFTQCALFWFSENDSLLSFTTIDKTKNQTPFEIKLNTNRSIISDAAIQNKIKSANCSSKDVAASLDYDLTVIDQQICRHLNSSGLLCIPIRSQEKLFGVLVLGCNEVIAEDSNLYRLLTYFASEVGNICETRFSQIQNSNKQIDQDTLQKRAHEIAHEANNPLNIINNYLLSLGQKIENIAPTSSEKEAVQEELAILREEVNRTSEIISRLRDLKKDAAKSEGLIDLNSEIQDLCTLYKHSLFLVNNVEYSIELDPELKEISGNKNELKQVLTNLIKNAAEAINAQGNIKISTAANVKMNGKTFAEIIIHDNGPGIPENILNNLFTPVKSTKGGNHSGLGLSITKNLVTDAKGTISCRSNAKGTSFQILLPQSLSKAANKEES